MRPVTSITVVYDATCGICTFAKDVADPGEVWIGRDIEQEFRRTLVPKCQNATR